MFGKGDLWSYNEPVTNDGPRSVTRNNSSNASKRRAPRSPPRQIPGSADSAVGSSSFTINLSQPRRFYSQELEPPFSPGTPPTPSTPYQTPLFPLPPSPSPAYAGPYYPGPSAAAPWPVYPHPGYNIGGPSPSYYPMYPQFDGYELPPSHQGGPFP